MNRVVFPLKLQMKSANVSDLHKALAHVRLKVTEAERKNSRFGATTRQAVKTFQSDHKLQPTGEVDKPTANAINSILKKKGVLAQPTKPPSQLSFSVKGQVRRDSLAIQGIRVLAIHEAATGFLELGEDITDDDGRYTIHYKSPDGVKAIRLRMTALDADGKPLCDFKFPREAKPVEIIDLIVPVVQPKVYRVEGKVASGVSSGVGGLRVVIVDKGVGSDLQLAQAVTDESGAFQASFSKNVLQPRGKEQPDLQARVFAGDIFLGASEVRYSASEKETLKVLLEDNVASALQSEHAVLIGAIAKYFKGKPGDLKETEEQQDITYLANKTGWDARAVALAALADQFSARTADASGTPIIPPSFFYALFRAGLPANEDMLYHTDSKTLESVWKKAAEKGVIPKVTDKQLSNLVERFQTVSAQKLLTGKVLVGASSFKDMLSGVSRLDHAQQEKFAELYAINRTDMEAVWKAVGEDSTFGATPDQRRRMVNRLQVDGKLGFLTINNALLMLKVHDKAGPNGLSDPLQLAQIGYHRPEPWKDLLTEEVPIPKEAPGDTPETKRVNYANYLAAQVRLSYPTASVAEMIKNADPNLRLTFAGQNFSEEVYQFLTKHQGNFEIGVHPVEQYIKTNGLEGRVVPDTVDQIKRLQRVYQITPSDEAMIGLMKCGIDAAYHVVRYDKDIFIQSFATDLGGADHAALTYERSARVHNTVLNIALSYLTARAAPTIGAHSAPSVLDPTPTNTGDVIACATLEKLFDSMDFCVCEHCRSILSPAAYLVDLLQFLDSSPTNPAAPISYTDPATQQQKNITPLDILVGNENAGIVGRRPDIQHLPLTCENTNTVLPYLDIVNETLEYYIANGLSLGKRVLDEYHGHDTNGMASEDLLASPQFVKDEAYDTLRQELFPAPLPFHQPLENLRRYFNKFEVPLSLAMERLRKTDSLEPGENNQYGWRDILMEEIGLSRREYEILTDFKAIPLWRMFGFPDGTADADVITGLSNVKLFARRINMSYDDLISILKTRFINPNSILIPKLERLGVSFATLKALKDGTIADSDFDKLLAQQAVPPEPVYYGGHPNDPKDDYTPIREWVKDGTNYSRIMGLITLAIPASTWVASKEFDLGDCVLPTASQGESTLYFECTTAGASGTSEPKWSATSGDTPQSDGTASWTCRNASSCVSFDNLAFRYSDPAKLTQNINAVEFVRLLRFIRLWKKLGWTIEQTDAAICALYNEDLTLIKASEINDVTKLDKGFCTLLPRLGIVIRVIKALNLTVNKDLLPLLACWSEIGTHGNTALYCQMFLNPTILKQDPFFADNGYGEFLADTENKLSEHAEALRSAFNLSGDEYDQIVAALGYQDNTSLTIPNVSEIYRRGWLSRKLKLSVREMLLLVQFTGLDPFAAPDLANPAILRLISLIKALNDRSLKSVAALYLVWNQDVSGKSAPDPSQIAAFARTLRVGFAAIETEFAVADDPDGAIAQTRMAMVYGAEPAAFFFGLLNDSITVEVEYSDPDGTMAPDAVRQAIENAAGKADSGNSKISYDDFRMCLSYFGVLTIATRDAIKKAGGTETEAEAFQTAVDSLYDKGQAVIKPFFARYPELESYYSTYVSDTSHLAIEKRNNLLKEILPELITRRKRQQALSAVSTITSTDPALTQTFLDSPTAPFPLHAVGQADQPALNEFLALEKPGLSVQFFASDKAMGDIIESSPIASKLDYIPAAKGVDNPLPANPKQEDAISGVWRGYLEAPESGFFNLRIETDTGAIVTLLLDGKAIEPVHNSTPWENEKPIELRAGMLYPICLTVENVRNVLRVVWDWKPRGQGSAVIPARFLYPAVEFKKFQETYVRFLKAASLALSLGLTANEMAYFATHSDYNVNEDGWFNAISVSGNPTLGIASELLKPLEALLDFARIKADISPSDESLLAVVKDPTSATQSTDSLLFTIIRWNQTWLNDVLAQFGSNSAGLEHFDLFRRVYDAFALIQKMGISAKALIQATTNDPKSDRVSDLQAALRARFNAADWREVVRPINDEMRSAQRNALVTYILHQMRFHLESEQIDTSDKLFEYFLMDVQMDPCMQTSRIRHALSSVQLFIERCLMNLELHVSPAAINAKRWAWMKRYRIWEANRKVYLFPENWLEAGLQGNKSSFFKEFESELLQSDITEDSATTALLSYLSKLEEVAKLEPCGIYHIPADPSDPNNSGEINHVVARTAGANRKYYYRRYEHGSLTPWEQIKLEIEDNPVKLYLWKDRLLLFWLRILREGPATAQMPPANTNLNALTTNDLPKETKVFIKAVLCWSEYYNGKWQPTKTSDLSQAIELMQIATNDFDRSIFGLRILEEGDVLRIVVLGGDNSSFLLYNTHSLPTPQKVKIAPPAGKTRRFFNWRVYPSYDYFFHCWYNDNKSPDATIYRQILKTPIPIESPKFWLEDTWDDPFFFADSRHVFFVTTEESPVFISAHRGYGASVNPGILSAPQIPPLVPQSWSVIPPKSWGGEEPVGAGPGVIDPGPISRYVSEDAYVRQGIGTTGVVRYGDRQIGPSGAIRGIKIERG